ncbi:CDK5 and ABL1 enzyme substrate 2-like isoform X2 [Oncorhynchus keta]|uniref:CDK5 and ABL1 enzyme substrate 2-like isoform X2 n=1 Tax=Oncorhynchus keta TaxID=8018 RepID=UPI00227C649A|nr:CDK5 and ABL1 enzyme substrate 2-like isoform X2 [Oncorhynchus keta]
MIRLNQSAYGGRGEVLSPAKFIPQRAQSFYYTRMATAVFGRQCTTGSNTAKSHKEHLRKGKDSRRRQAALLFLNNISLDGRPLYHLSNGNHGQREAAELRSRDATGAQATGHPLFSSSIYGTVSLVAPSLAGGAAPTVAGISGLSPVPPNLVLSTDTGSSTAVRWSEVFFEGVDPMVPPDTHLSPTSGPQTFNPSAKSSFALQTQNSVPGDTQRSRNHSGSPKPVRVAKKVHFIKNMRQYDTRSSRIMMICAKRSLCAAFSVLPYGERIHLSDPKLEVHKRQLSSGVASDLFPGLEGLGVELGAYGKTVSYAQFLFPTNALVRPKSSGALEPSTTQTPLSRYQCNGQKNYTTPSRLNSTIGQDLNIEDLPDYDPYLLSDPQWPCGRHKRVLIFSSYVTTVIEYVKPSDLKKDMNETFKEKFPYIKLTLSKIRRCTVHEHVVHFCLLSVSISENHICIFVSKPCIYICKSCISAYHTHPCVTSLLFDSLKWEMRAVGEECSLQPVTVAMAFVYFEKLVLQGRLNKQNRKLVSAACVLLAAKISSDLKKQEVRQLIDKLEERFRINRRELIPLEFPVLVALEMGLYLPDSKVMPHYRRLVQQG